MRLYFELTKNTQLIPFDYQYQLMGVLHKWLGNNDVHNGISLYSFGWLKGRCSINKGLNFGEGATWFISFHDLSIGKIIISNVMDNPDAFYGMKVNSIQIQDDLEFRDEERFFVSSPVLIRKYEDNKAIHLTYKDEEADQLLTQTLTRKLALAEINAKAEIKFDRSYNNAKTKLITIKETNNKASLCPVIISGDPIAIKFARNVGIGHLTGCGFGAVL